MALQEYPPLRDAPHQESPPAKESGVPNRLIGNMRESVQQSLKPAAAFAHSLIEFCKEQSVTLSGRHLSETEMLAMVSGARRTLAREEKLSGDTISEDRMYSLLHGVAGEGVLHALLSDYSQRMPGSGMQMLCENTTGTYSIGRGAIWIPKDDPYNVVFQSRNREEPAVECDAAMVDDAGSRLYTLDVTTSRYTLEEKLEHDTDTKANMIHRCVQSVDMNAPELETHFFHILLTDRTDALEKPYQSVHQRVSVLRLPFQYAAKAFTVDLQLWEKAHRSADVAVMRQCFRGKTQSHPRKLPWPATTGHSDFRSRSQQP